MEHTGLFFLFTFQPTKGCNCSRSGVNVCAHLLRNNFSKNLSLIRSGPMHASSKGSKRRFTNVISAMHGSREGAGAPKILGTKVSKTGKLK